MLVANADQIRKADQIQINDKGFPGILLMEAAGRKAAEYIAQHYPDSDFVIVAGKGNNGGDGWVIARYLYQMGRKVFLFSSCDPHSLSGDALINARIALNMHLPWALWSEAAFEHLVENASHKPVLIDALLGTGIKGSLRTEVREILDTIKKKELEVVAIDLPSGLNASSGKVEEEVLAANCTLTFQLPKLCHYVTPASNYCGELIILDIGLWPEVIHSLGIKRKLVEDTYVRSTFLSRRNDGHKGTYGHVLVIGGSAYMAGAIALTAMGVLYSGAGLCTVYCPSTCRQTVLTHCPESMVVPSKTNEDYFSASDIDTFLPLLEGKTAVVIGPGIGMAEETIRFIQELVPMIHIPMVLDADALNILAKSPSATKLDGSRTILSPHPGELRRWEAVPDPGTERLEAVEAFVEKYKCHTLLKGAFSLMSHPDGSTYINTTGNPGMATGGSGDVLSGAIAAFLAQGYGPKEALHLAVYFHGKAGDTLEENTGQAGITARQLAVEIGKTMMEFE